MKKRKFGLIIQGTLTSKNKKIKNHVYDCNINIKNLLDNFSHLFSEIVLATWENEKSKISKEILKFKKLKFLFLKDPGIPELYSNDLSDNRLRQFYSSYKGIESFSDEIEVVIKIRTDLYIDLKKTIDFFQIEEDRKTKLLKLKFEGVICSKRFYLTHPYWLSDFLYIGNKNIMREFFLCQIKYKKERFALYKRGLPEGDSILKFLFFNRKKIKVFSESKYFPSLPKKLDGTCCVYYKNEFDLWQFAIRQYFSVLPYEITKTAIWKGKNYHKYHEKKRKIYGFKDFLDAENNYVEALNKVPNSPNTFILFNYNFSFINFNYIKRKFENTLNGKYSMFNFFEYFNKLNFYHRRILFFIFKKR